MVVQALMRGMATTSPIPMPRQSAPVVRTPGQERSGEPMAARREATPPTANSTKTDG